MSKLCIRNEWVVVRGKDGSFRVCGAKNVINFNEKINNNLDIKSLLLTSFIGLSTFLAILLVKK